MQYIQLGLRFLIGTVFLVSTATKLREFGAFVASVPQLGPPARYATPVALVVVALEASVCLLLAVPRPGAFVAGLSLAAGLLAVFAGAALLAIRRGRRAPCRCFGATATPLGLPHVVRNGALALSAAVGATLAVAPTGSPAAAGALIAAVTGITAGVVVVVADDIAQLFRRTASIGQPSPEPRVTASRPRAWPG